MTRTTAPASFGFAAAGIFAFAPGAMAAGDAAPAARLAALSSQDAAAAPTRQRPTASAAEIFNAARTGAARRTARA